MADSRRPFDLAKLDFDKIRKRKRRRLLVVSAPVVAVILLIAFKLISMNVSFSYGMQSYKASDFSGSARWFDGLLIVNVFEPYKAGFAKGSAELSRHNFAQAAKDLQDSLNRGVPKDNECQVRVNLTLAWIGRGDEQVQEEEYDNAIISYDKAKAVVDGRDCGLKLSQSKSSDGAKQADKQLKQARKSASDKQNAAKQARNGDSSATSQGANDTTENDPQAPPTKDQQEQLEKIQRDNARKLNSDRNNSRYNDGKATNSYDSRNW